MKPVVDTDICQIQNISQQDKDIGIYVFRECIKRFCIILIQMSDSQAKMLHLDIRIVSTRSGKP